MLKHGYCCKLVEHHQEGVLIHCCFFISFSIRMHAMTSREIKPIQSQRSNNLSRRSPYLEYTVYTIQSDLDQFARDCTLRQVVYVLHAVFAPLHLPRLSGDFIFLGFRDEKGTAQSQQVNHESKFEGRRSLNRRSRLQETSSTSALLSLFLPCLHSSTTHCTKS